MLIKIGSLEIRTGKDAKGDKPVQTNRDDIPALPYHNPTVGAGLGMGTYVAPAQTERVAPPPTPENGLALYHGHKPHPMTAAIEWPEIPDDPMSQTRLSLLVNETDTRFRKYQSVDICSLRDYVQREGITLYGKANEAFELLREFHCKDFHLLHPSVVKSIPSLYTEIFRAMKGEYDINDAWRL